MVAIGKIVFTSREHIIALESRGKELLGVTAISYDVRNEADYRREDPEGRECQGRWCIRFQLALIQVSLLRSRFIRSSRAWPCQPFNCVGLSAASHLWPGSGLLLAIGAPYRLQRCAIIVVSHMPTMTSTLV